MAWNPLGFDRNEYLRYASAYEGTTVNDFESELCEFNHDPMDLAADLSYLRYHFAKLEEEKKRLNKILDVVVLTVSIAGLESIADSITDARNKEESNGDDYSI